MFFIFYIFGWEFPRRTRDLMYLFELASNMEDFRVYLLH